MNSIYSINKKMYNAVCSLGGGRESDLKLYNENKAIFDQAGITSMPQYKVDEVLKDAIIYNENKAIFDQAGITSMPQSGVYYTLSITDRLAEAQLYNEHQLTFNQAGITSIPEFDVKGRLADAALYNENRTTFNEAGITSIPLFDVKGRLADTVLYNENRSTFNEAGITSIPPPFKVKEKLDDALAYLSREAELYLILDLLQKYKLNIPRNEITRIEPRIILIIHSINDSIKELMENNILDAIDQICDLFKLLAYTKFKKSEVELCIDMKEYTNYINGLFDNYLNFDSRTDDAKFLDIPEKELNLLASHIEYYFINGNGTKVARRDYTLDEVKSNTLDHLTDLLKEKKSYHQITIIIPGDSGFRQVKAIEMYLRKMNIASNTQFIYIPMSGIKTDKLSPFYIKYLSNYIQFGTDTDLFIIYDFILQGRCVNLIKNFLFERSSAKIIIKNIIGIEMFIESANRCQLQTRQPSKNKMAFDERNMRPNHCTRVIAWLFNHLLHKRPSEQV